MRIALEATMLAPGRWLRGTVIVGADGPQRGLELSVLWRTSGSGRVDEGIVHFQSLGEEVDRGRPIPFEVRLPITPASYRGEHVNIDWLVRVRGEGGSVCDAPFEVTP